MVALGSSATGVFTNSPTYWELMRQAGGKTGDRVWRMPLFKHYTKQVTEAHLADLNNIGSGGRMGGACTAAAFLRVSSASMQSNSHIQLILLYFLLCTIYIFLALSRSKNVTVETIDFKILIQLLLCARLSICCEIKRLSTIP